MNTINEFYTIVCSIKCGGEIGSGFLVAPDLILTADHVIAPSLIDGTLITAKFEGDDTPLECTVESPVNGDSSPLALLRIEKSRESIHSLIGDMALEQESAARAYGFFPSDTKKADNISLKCVRTFDDGDDCNVSFKPQDERRDSFKGFSGAPIVVNGYIVGILIKQASVNTTAIRLYGIYGLKFRELLAKYGLKMDIHKQLSNLQQVSNNSVVSLQAVDPVHVSEMDIILSELFKPIREDRENGEVLKSQEELRGFLKRLHNRSCTDRKKAEFYYIGAVWMLLDQNHEEAEVYYQEAKRVYPELDDAVYRAYTLLGRGAIAQAKDCLKPIDSTPKLNAYISCLTSEKEQLSTIQAVIKAMNLTEDRKTYRLLAIAALQSGDFEEGHQYVSQARAGDKINVDLSVIEALLYYWSAMNNAYPEADRLSFAFVSNFYFCPTAEQKNGLEAAYQILENIYESEAAKKNDKIRGGIAWALLVISKALPGKDCAYWLENFRRCCYLHPLDIIYSTSNKMEIPEKLCEDFLALSIPENNCSVYAFAKLELFVFLGDYQKAREFFAEYKDAISEYHSIGVDECELQLMIECKDYSAARKILKGLSLSPEEKTRYDIGIQSREGTKVFKPLVKAVIDLAQKTKKTIDFHNASIICQKYKKWNEAIKNSKEWWKTTGELVALETLAEALYEKNEFVKCLQVVEKAETQGDDSLCIKQYKLNALVALARYEEAREIANTFDSIETNAKLTVVQARTFIAEGNPDKAIQTLRAYADKDLYDFEVYRLLIDLIRGDNPEMAFNYADLLYQHNSDDEQIIRFAGMVALMTAMRSRICPEDLVC